MMNRNLALRPLHLFLPLALAGVLFGCSSRSSSEIAVHPRGSRVTVAEGQHVADLPIPADYVQTPNGFFHKSCVIQVESDETVIPGEVIKGPNGAVKAIEPCHYPPMNEHGKVIDPLHHNSAASSDPGVSGWYETAEVDQVTVSKISANWTVPHVPNITANGQKVYFFPALEPSDQATLFQPVLGYNSDDKPNQWSIQSWLCCDTSYNQYKSAGVSVQAVGDAISGYAQGSGCDSGTGSALTGRCTLRTPTAAQS